MTAPNVGEFFLFDYVEPPLVEGSYRLTVTQSVSQSGTSYPITGQEGYFAIEGPRLAIAPTDVAGVFPPRDGHGAFEENLPHVAFFSKTLPWERTIGGGQATGTPTPWMALLLLSDGEYSIARQVDAIQSLPNTVPDLTAGDKCDILKVREDRLAAIMPTATELQLLAHVRQVNVDDRELGAGDSDGWFAIVVANRLPKPGVKHRACLVSLQGRQDLIPADGQPSTPSAHLFTPKPTLTPMPLPAHPGVSVPAAEHVITDPTFRDRHVTTALALRDRPEIHRKPIPTMVSLVLLHSWEFTCEGTATFEYLMSHVDDGAFGDPTNGRPDVLDSGHIALDMTNRAGEEQQVLYRGPLVPFPLTRDSMGPYHSADQCRRVVLEVGAEDVSYSAAFEVGRLLASADARLAQELMRWRREAYRRAARIDLIAQLPREWMTPVAGFGPDIPSLPLGPIAAVAAVRQVRSFSGPLGDPLGTGFLNGLPGADPATLADAWGLPVNEMRAMLDPQSQPATLTPPTAQTQTPNVDVSQLANDRAVRQPLLDALGDIEREAERNAGIPGHP